MPPVVVGVISSNMCRRFEEKPQLIKMNDKPKASVGLAQAVLKDHAVTMHTGRADLSHLFKQLLPKKGFVHRHSIGDALVSILPALTIKQPPDMASWSAYSAGDPEMCCLAAPPTMCPTRFLQQYCIYTLGYGGRIDYALHLFERPLVFGEATLYDTGHTSYFASVLSAKEMAELLLLENERFV
jgi:hypothetical protein